MKEDKTSGTNLPPSKKLLESPNGPSNYIKRMRAEIDACEVAYRLSRQMEVAHIYMLGSFLSEDERAWRLFCKKTVWPESLQNREKPCAQACRWIVAAAFSERRLFSKYSIVCENLRLLECAPEDALEKIQKETLERLSKRLGDERTLPRKRRPAIRVKLPDEIGLPEKEKKVRITGILKPLPRGGYQLDVSKLVRLKPARPEVPKKSKRLDR